MIVFKLNQAKISQLSHAEWVASKGI